MEVNMSKPTPRLGKGLSAILPARATAPPLTRTGPTAHAPSADAAIHQIPIHAITPNPRQPRRAADQTALNQLADSIRANGVLQPVVLRPAGPEQYELVVGERRWRAARLAGLETIPAIIRNFTDAQSLELALVENLQREDLGPLERAAGYQDYVSTFGVSIEQLATRLGESRANISNYLRLLRLRPEVQDLLTRGELAMGQARAVAGIDSPQRQLAIARLAARRNLSVRHVERLAKRADQPSATAPPDTRIKPKHVTDVEQALTRALGLPVMLRPGRKKNSGHVIIRYDDLEQFDRIAERIGGRAALEER
jgi:ParB family chromosome partitioning protein